MNVLELFAGTRSIGKAFESKGHKVFSVEWDEKHKNINLYKDIEYLDMRDIPFIPDIIWASPDCTTYSYAGHGLHRWGKQFNYKPKSDYASKCDRVNKHLWNIIESYRLLNPNLIFFVENPRGMYVKMNFTDIIPKLVTYCQYGFNGMKPTHIFTNIDIEFKSCKAGDNCHKRSYAGGNSSVQGISRGEKRSIIPALLCEYIVSECEKRSNIKV